LALNVYHSSTKNSIARNIIFVNYDYSHEIKE